MRRDRWGEQVYARLCSISRCCGKDSNAAERIHSEIIRSGYGGDRFLGNLVVKMYGNCGRVEDAVEAFKRIQKPNVFSWTILAAALLQNDRLQEGGNVFRRMPQHNVVSATAMVAAFVSAGLVAQATTVFTGMSERNAVTWTTLLGDGGLVTEAFGKMPQWDCVALNAMLAANAACGNLVQAKRLFDTMPEKNEVSWNTIMDVLSQNQCLASPYECFGKMAQWTSSSWNTMIAAFARAGDVITAKETFDAAPERDVISWNSLLEAHNCSGNVDRSRKVFDLLPRRSQASWSSMIAGLAEAGRVKDGVELLLSAMQLNGFHPESHTFSALITASAANGSLDQGRILHKLASTCCGTMHKLSLASLILHMYSECGCLVDAELVFSGIQERDLDLVAWSSMICAYAHHGHGERALDLFHRMAAAGIEPDDVVFVSIIAACSHSGLLDHSVVFFRLMTAEFVLAAGLDHYKSIIDALGRAGLIDLALELLQSMPFLPDRNCYTAFLGACNSHGGGRNVRVEVEQEGIISGAVYILLANLKLH